MQTFLDALKSHAQNRPTKQALVAESEQISYRMLIDKVEALALELDATGAETVAFQLDNGVNWVMIDIACCMAGISSVPIPSFFSKDQITHLVSDSNADLLIFGSSFQPADEWQLYPRIEIGSACVYVPEIESVEANIAAISKKSPVPMKVTYTSGSTGQPKGVCIAYETIDRVTQSIVESLEGVAIERHLCVLPLATLLENIAGLYAPLMRGITVHVPSLETVGLSGASLDIEKFVKIVVETDPHSLILVPQLLTALVTLIQFEQLKPDNFTMLAVGGGRVSAHLLQAAEALGLPVCEGYGLSECSSVLTLNLPGNHKVGSVGRPLPHASLRINDVGEIEARGSNMRCYQGEQLNRTQTGEAGTQDLQWYATGDLGYIDAQGYVFVTGRRKNVFITSFGRNVNPEWVESALSQHPAVSAALIYGEAKDHNLALIWCRFPTNKGALADIVADANAELPDYARAHQFLLMSEPIPSNLITANGRLKRIDALCHYQSVIDNHYSSLCCVTQKACKSSLKTNQKQTQNSLRRST